MKFKFSDEANVISANGFIDLEGDIFIYYLPVHVKWTNFKTIQYFSMEFSGIACTISSQLVEN